MRPNRHPTTAGPCRQARPVGAEGDSLASVEGERLLSRARAPELSASSPARGLLGGRVPDGPIDQRAAELLPADPFQVQELVLTDDQDLVVVGGHRPDVDVDLGAGARLSPAGRLQGKGGRAGSSAAQCLMGIGQDRQWRLV